MLAEALRVTDFSLEAGSKLVNIMRVAGTVTNVKADSTSEGLAHTTAQPVFSRVYSQLW